jgi:putative ABC transport system substrate-binding protein
MLLPGDENDPVSKANVSAFTQALAGLGWTDGRNVRMDLRWFGGDINRARALAQELVSLQPDIILANGSLATIAVQRETRVIPIVFANALGDPVAIGLVPRLNQPGGNITGFADFEPTLGGKWLELLSEIAPGLKRAAIMFNPDFPAPSTYMPAFETAARSLKVEPIIAPVHSDVEIETAINALGREPGGGLVIPGGAVHRAPIISAAARNNVPAVYYHSAFARDGGLLSYAVDPLDPFRRAATYVDRILRGEKPGLLRLLPAGAIAGWDLHPLENAAFPRRTPKPDSCSAAKPTLLFDDLVGAKQDRLRHRKAERLGGLEVYDHLKFCRKLPAPRRA